MELEEFLHSRDFMKIGQAITHGQWQVAAMANTRLTNQAKALELSVFLRPLQGLRQAILRKNEREAKQALAIVIAKRAALWKEQSGV